MKRIFRFFTIRYWKDYIRLKHILKCIKNAKKRFIEDRIDLGIISYGLCHYLGTELFGDMRVLKYDDIKNIIPIFTPEYFNARTNRRYGFWWHIYDTYSRIGAFDKLINHYKKSIKNL